ncbi:MAG TPA: hypothetical protein EYG99_00460 [Candidatus Pacebacteria bacterium]|nr:hypothetical protein [Candidatus Paceibacterota bacterium]
MPIGEPTMGSVKPKKKDVISISSDNLEADIDEVFSDIRQDMRDVKIEGDKIITIDDVDALGKSVNAVFGDKPLDVEVDKRIESSGVVAIASEKVKADKEVQRLIMNGEEEMVNKVIEKMTTDPEIIDKFFGKLADAPDKAAHIEQATKKLAETIKEVIISKSLLNDSIIGNS